MGKTNLGLRLEIGQGEVILSFGCGERKDENGKSTVAQIVLDVTDKEGNTAVLRLDKSEALNLARRLMVGSVELSRSEQNPHSIEMVSFCKARGLDNMLDTLLEQYFKIL